MRSKATSLIGLFAGFTILTGCMDSSGLSLNGTGGVGGNLGAGGVKASGGTVSMGGTPGSSTNPSGGAGAGGMPGASGGATTASGGASAGVGGATGGGAGGRSSGAGGFAVASGGAGGTIICPAIACVVPKCDYGTMPGPPPCGCPICAPAPDGGTIPDASSKQDVGIDGPAVCTAACIVPNCPNGTVKGPPPCNCPVCAPSDAGARGDARGTDAGASDAPVICGGILCPALACINGYVPTPTPCGCPTCAPLDAGLPDVGAGDAGACLPVVCPMIACLGEVVPSATACGCPACGPVPVSN